MLRKVLTTILLLAVFLVAGSVAMSCASRRVPSLGVTGGASGGAKRLTPCPDSPNCVNSQEDDSEHGIAPLRFEGEPSVALKRLVGLLEETPRARIVGRTEDYLRVEFTSGFLRFVDDVEFLVLPSEKVIHVRSASRVGHSDLGANRKRVEALRARWSEPVEEKTGRLGEELFRFDTKAACEAWQSIDDVVMGGRSRGELVFSEAGTAIFQGEVSLENNGGFSSVRSNTTRLDLSQASQIVLRVRGDGQIYQLRLRDEDGDNGVNYCAEFTAPAGEWADVRVAIDELQPRFRGRVLTDVPPLNRSLVRSLGLLIAEKQVGPFRLEIERIAAEADGPKS